MENPSGVTITDMAKELKFSKNTISKYIEILKLKSQVYNSPIGRYNLYFSTKKTFIPSKVIISMYKALFLALKTKLPQKERLYIEIGKELQKNFNYRYSKGFFENEVKKKVGLENLKDYKPHFEYFIEVFNSSNILQDTAQVTHLMYENEDKTGIFRITNSDFLENNDDYIFYFYMIAGIIEAYLSEEMNRNVTCKILNINISENKENSYVDLSITIE
jgi:hypothetical protein